jgi:group I intron endonuclease
MFYTYAHTKPDGTIFYIGKGQGRRAWSIAHRNRHWKFVVAKHGSFEVTILSEHETEKEALDEEIELIAHFKKFGFLTNKTDGGEGWSGCTHTEEHKEYMRNLMLGREISQETRNKISATSIANGSHAGENNPMFGRKRTEEELKNISEQTRKKMAEQGFTHVITIDGKTFNSKRELARFLGVHHRTVNDWSKLGILEEKYRARMD